MTDETIRRWCEYLATRSKIALGAYREAFEDDGAVRSPRNAYALARDVHAFFTHGAMVARVFIPSERGKKGEAAKQRAQELRRRIAPLLAPFQSCLDARHNLDHFDERLDAVIDQPDALVNSSATIAARNVQDLEHFGERPMMLMLTYLRDDRAIVTYSAKGDRCITSLEPIQRELELVLVRSLSTLDKQAHRPAS